MATKTFKIGLSSTDKANMAQDIYEQVLALTFPEYETTETYAVGDFVVYENQLYKCIGATSGAWDSTKWQLATLNDILTDIEGAVAYVNDKANVDGNYPTMTVGLADNLTPYSEDSGDEQDEPFILQGTGCGNGTEIVTTGDYALLKEKQGNTLKVVQSFKASGNDSDNGISLTKIDDTLIKLNGTASANSFTTAQSSIDLVNGHKYFIRGGNTAISGVKILFENIVGASFEVGGAVWTSNATTTTRVRMRVESGTQLDNVELEISIFDITEWDTTAITDITTHPEHFFRYYQGSLAYNTGSLETSAGRYLECTGRNIWDEIAEVGNIDSSNGQNDNSITTKIRSKDYIQVIANADYYIYAPINLNLFFYDKDKNFIKADTSTSTKDTHYKMPNNCVYIRFSTWGSTITTYNHDITITPYYPPEQGGEGYDQYYPYEEPFIVDTGSETLLSAGSVRDIKTPDGVVHRLVGNIVFDGSSDENWKLYTTEESRRFYIDVSDFKGSPDTLKANILCDKLETVSKAVLNSSDGAISAGDSNSARIMVRINSSVTTVAQLKTWLSSNNLTVYYELATPTTEQGTPFSPNLKINDYGQMGWLNSSNNPVSIPQGNLIFYPVNYKGFVDDAYSRTSGNASKIALTTELASSFETYLKGLSGYDATATQVLKNVEGTLTWVTEE